MVVSLGFDTYGQDPIGDFALTTDVYHEVGRRAAAARQAARDPRRRAATTCPRWARTPARGCAASRAAQYDPRPALGFNDAGVEA